MAVSEGKKLKAIKPRNQIAALPFRREPALEILLVSSRETRRWVLPKGWPMKGLKPHRAAAIEAREEAGVEGRIGKVAVGTYDYDKRLPDGSAVPCRVRVFPLEVTRQMAHFAEMHERVSRWFAPGEAAAAVDEADLAALIRRFAAELAPAAEQAPPAAD